MSEQGKKEDCRRLHEMINTHMDFLKEKMCEYIIILRTVDRTKDIERLTKAIGFFNNSGIALSEVKYWKT